MSTGPQTPSQYVPSTPLSHQQSYPPQHYEKFSTSTFFQSPGHHVHSTPHGTSGMSHYQQPGGYGSAVPGGGSGGAASTGPSTQLIPSSSTNIHNMIPSEYYYEERSKLEKLNFDLKMKIFHLEEQQKSNLEETKKQDLLLDSSKAELLDYKLQLEEKEIELEQRNLLLLKAKNAIENLKHEIEKSKQELSRCQDLETRVLKLKELNDEMDLDSKQQVMILEHELERMYDVMKGKEQEKIVLEERLKQLEDNFQSQGQRLQETMTDKIRVEERIKQLTIHVQNNDEEITQCYAQIDLLKIQLIEENEQQDKLKVRRFPSFIRGFSSSFARIVHFSAIYPSFIAQFPYFNIIIFFFCEIVTNERIEFFQNNHGRTISFKDY